MVVACLNREYGEALASHEWVEMRVSRFELMHGCESETVGVHGVLFLKPWVYGVWSILLQNMHVEFCLSLEEMNHAWKCCLHIRFAWNEFPCMGDSLSHPFALVWAMRPNLGNVNLWSILTTLLGLASFGLFHSFVCFLLSYLSICPLFFLFFALIYLLTTNVFCLREI